MPEVKINAGPTSIVVLDNGKETTVMNMTAVSGDITFGPGSTSVVRLPSGKDTTAMNVVILDASTPPLPVLSVNGEVGDVVLTASDIGAADAADLVNKVSKSGDTISGPTQVSGNPLLDLRGTNSGSQILGFGLVGFLRPLSVIYPMSTVDAQPGFQLYMMDKSNGNLLSEYRIERAAFSGDGTIALGTAARKWVNVFTTKINNGGDINIPTVSGTMALTSAGFILKIHDDFVQNITTGVQGDLLNSFNLGTDIVVVANKIAADFNLTAGVLKLPSLASYTNYTIEVRLFGTIAGAAGTAREFSIELRRASDASVVSKKAIIKINSNNLSSKAVSFDTFTNTITDPFIAGGLTFVLDNTSGQTINLTAKEFVIKGTNH